MLPYLQIIILGIDHKDERTTAAKDDVLLERRVKIIDLSYNNRRTNFTIKAKSFDSYHN
jgi:hypothetical protein